MKISKFNKINARTYENFTWPSELPEFENYNLIYGWNGSGKTTLADILRMIEKRQQVSTYGIYRSRLKMRKSSCDEGSFMIKCSNGKKTISTRAA